MSNIFADFITTATLGQPVMGVAPAADADMGFGSDMSCDSDITALAIELDQNSPLVVAQAVYRRLITPRTTLVDDPDYGLDVRRFLHRGMSATQFSTIPGQIRNEISKDDRVFNVRVTIQNVSALSFEVAILGNCAVGTFSLTLGVTDSEVVLKEMRQAA